jgi:hypothetical protein
MLETLLRGAALVDITPATPASTPVIEHDPEEWRRGLALAKASEEAARASLDRIMREAAAPKAKWAALNAAPPAPPVARSAPVTPAASAPAPPSSLSPLPRVATPAPVPLREAPVMTPQQFDQLMRAHREALADEPIRPVLHGRASPSLTRLLRSRGQETLSANGGSPKTFQGG